MQKENNKHHSLPAHVSVMAGIIVFKLIVASPLVNGNLHSHLDKNGGVINA